MVSRKPSVVSNPTLAVFPVRRAFVERVVPWAISSPTLAMNRGRSRPKCLEAFSSTRISPAAGSAGTVSDLNSWISPASSRTRQSVNVPPTSIVTRIIAQPLPGAPLLGIRFLTLVRPQNTPFLWGAHSSYRGGRARRTLPPGEREEDRDLVGGADDDVAGLTHVVALAVDDAGVLVGRLSSLIADGGPELLVLREGALKDGV